MAKKKPLILFVNNIAPLYRESVWVKYLESKHMNLQFFFGKKSYGGIKTIDFSKKKLSKFSDRVHFLNNTYIKNKYLIWQNLALYKWLKKKPDTIILLGDFVIISNWLLTLLAKKKKVEVVMKGHGMYGNEKGLKLFLRKSFLKLADKHLVYERHGKRILEQNGIPAQRIHILFNSLDYDIHLAAREKIESLDKASILHFFDQPMLPTLLFIGRLTSIKKLDLIIKAAETLVNKGIHLNVLFVGDGSEKEHLENLAETHLTKGTYHFYGASYDEEANSRLIAVSDLCVAPGNVGLTAIHSLSYGTPVCTHSNMLQQMPEAEAIEDGVNGVLFEDNNLDSLSQAIETWLANNPNRADVRKKAYKIIDEYYNPYYQTKVLENLVAGNDPLI